LDAGRSNVADQGCLSRIQTFSIPDPGSKRFRIPVRIHIKKINYFKPKKLLLNSQKYDLKCSSRIRIPDLDPDVLPIRDTGVKKAPDPGSGSATLEGRINTMHMTRQFLISV
jgi:hypothetical protein